MNLISVLALCLFTGYFAGSINPAIILSKSKGRDIRTLGSGNAGATNTLRNFGKLSALIVLLADVLKCVVAVLFGGFIAKTFNQGIELLGEIAAAMGCILGHNFPIYFKFKGGKGVVVSATAIFMLDWRVGIAALLSFIVIFAISRYVSLGSVLSACIAVVASVFFAYRSSWLLGNNLVLFFVIFAALLTIIRHHANIARLIKGTESKTTFSKK